jgi:hypothetical protein
VDTVNRSNPDQDSSIVKVEERTRACGRGPTLAILIIRLRATKFV